MQVKEILKALIGIAPLQTALDYDNVGLLVGDPEQTVTRAVVCLDCTPLAVELAVNSGAQLIISHHPVIFEPLKRVVKNDGNVVYDCLANGISVISMHTNLDVAEGGVNDCLARALELEQVVSVTDEEGFVFKKGTLKAEMSADELAEYVKARLGGNLRYTDGGRPIKTVCVCGGSGGGEFAYAIGNADAFVTADVKHSLFIQAATVGYTLVDAGHFHTENVVVDPLCDRLKSLLTGVELISFNGGEIKTL